MLSKFTPLKEPKKEKPFTWALPYITGKTYQVWWASGIDFTHMSLFTSSNWNTADQGIIFKFNYTEYREIFEIGQMAGGARVLNATEFKNKSTTHLDPATCNNGDYYHDNSDTNRMMTLCQSGKSRSKYEYTEVNGIMCRYLCPLPPGNFIKEDFIREWSNATQWPGGVLPKAGDDVVVNGNWTVMLDVDPAVLNNLTIDGTLVANDTRDVNITANAIFVRSGNITAGSSSKPFTHKFTIQVNGNKVDPGFVIDPLVGGNKFFVVTGILNLYGVAPTSVITPLAATALAGTNTIQVKDSTDWVAGDTLVLSPSFADHLQHETVTIQSMNTDGTITLTSNLIYTHFGASGQTVSHGHGNIDARTRVGHVNRNIQITSGPDVGWGMTTVVYGYKDENNVTRIGSVNLKGVQFNNGGQLDSYDASLRFLNVLGGKTSTVSATSFMTCYHRCLHIESSENIDFLNNVLYNSHQYSVQMKSIKSLNFKNNLMVGVIDRPSVTVGFELSACLFVETSVATTDKVAVKDNYCLGSKHHGFAVPLSPCGVVATEYENNPFANNTAGATKIGFILNTNGQSCQTFSYAKAFGTQIGQICGSPGILTVKFSHFIMIDNGRGVTLKLGASEGGHDHTAYLYNSYIGAVSRSSCAECYGASALSCSNTHGMRMFTASANGEVMPQKFGTGFDVICKQPVFDSKSFIYNVEFNNFRQSYSGAAASCSSNHAMRPHSGAFDQVGSANLFDCTCVNCDTNSYLLANSPSSSQLGWFGGCGDILCTGFNNYLVQDHTGSFFGSAGTIIGNNSVIGEGESCTASTAMNAHMCTGRTDFAVLEYQNVDADKQSRIMWPVYLNFTGSNYRTETNGWREWEWLGNEPMNKRFGRFVSIVTLNQTYNMTFASEPPHKLEVQIQKRTPTGNNDNFIIVQLHYPRPNSIRINKNGVLIDPILLTDVNNTASGVKEPLNTAVCGSNIYFYTNYTTHFVVTEAADCNIVVELTETVQLTTHFAINITDFFNSNNAITNFINNLCALLNIQDTSRVKVVGVHSGSTVITVSITPSVTPVASDPSLPTIASSIASSSNLTSGLSGIGLGSVIGVSTVYYPITDETTDSSSLGLIIGAAVAGVLLAIGVIITVICCMRRRAKVVEEIVTHDDEMVHDKSIDKEKHFEFNSSDSPDVVPNESEIKIKNNQRSNHNILRVHNINENSEIIE